MFGQRMLIPALALSLLGASCASTPWPRGGVMVQTEHGVEQGVSTPYGVLFLGKTASAGPCEIVTFFGDGPSIESGRIRNISDQLYQVEVDLRIPTSEVSFTYPSEGDDLILGVSDGSSTQFYNTRIVNDATVRGTAVEMPGGLTMPAAAGAPLFRREDGRYRVVGLVSGVARYETANGKREVLTYLGPRDLVPAAMFDRERQRPRPQVHREDSIR
ncbi:MAG: hypothetical protein HY286_14970 [Planctomycetes bacterium]|nr:hypothetical protein [Planctomycetota bacterium]